MGDRVSQLQTLVDLLANKMCSSVHFLSVLSEKEGGELETTKAAFLCDIPIIVKEIYRFIGHLPSSKLCCGVYMYLCWRTCWKILRLICFVAHSLLIIVFFTNILFS